MRDFAALTITRNEPLFLRAWCNYYCSVFGPDNVHVINNSTTDGSVEAARLQWPGIHVHDRPHQKEHDSLWLKELVESHQCQLLDSHRCVVFSETDEFLIPGSQWDGLKSYCDSFLRSDKRWARATGWNVVHQVASEPALDQAPGQPLLQHRNAMWRAPVYDKTLVTKAPLTYQKGFHNFYLGGTKQVHEPRDSELALCHLWCLDVEEFHRRHGTRLGLSLQQATELFRGMEHKTNDFGDPWIEGPRHEVPAHWRQLLRC